MAETYAIENWTLPVPAFPFVANNTSEPLWAIVRKTQDDQLESVKMQGVYCVFSVKDGVVPQAFEEGEKERTLRIVRGLCHLAMLYRVPLTSKTIARGPGLISAWAVRAIAPFLHMALPAAEFRKFVISTGTVDRLGCAKWIASQVADWLDLEGVCQFVGGCQSEFFGPYETVLQEFTDDWSIDFL